MNRFSMWSLVILLALVAGTSANAADFKGFYVGASVGAAYGSSDVHTVPVFSPTGYFAATSVGAISLAAEHTLKPTRFTGGVQAGYNFESGIWLYGVEASISSVHLSDAASGTATYPCCAPTAFTINQSITTTWLSTIRGRLGVTHGPWLIYGTGGLATTDRDYEAVFTDTFATAHESASSTHNVMGWVAGGGVEAKTSKHWSLKGEFLHAAFGDSTVTSTNLTAFTPPIAFPTNVFTHGFGLTENLINFGFNYHF